MVFKKETWRDQSRKMVIHHEVFRFARAFRDNFVTLMIAALGFLVALSWNNFWNAWVNTLTLENTLPVKFVVAMSMTILAVILTYVFSKLKPSNQ